MWRGITLVLGWACVACGGGDQRAVPEMDASVPPTYENVAAVVNRACGFEESCHGGAGAGQAGLNFATHDTLQEAWETDNGSPRASCEYGPMPIVDPGHPENSWLMVKIADGPVDGDLNIVAGDWGPADGFVMGQNEDCPSLGQRMPQIGDMLTASEVAMFRAWIADGAPGT